MLIKSYKEPVVSIIMPTYNRINFLKKAVNSVFRQTFENWELIIINNDSRDGTEEYLRELSVSDSRIKILHTEKSKIPGISDYLNQGILLSAGKYIARIDDDDTWSFVDKLKIQVDFFEKNTSFVLTGGGQIMVDENGKELYRVLKNEKDDAIRKKALLACPFEHTTVMFRKDVSLCVGNYKAFRLSEDWEFFLNMGTAGKLYNFPEYFVNYTQWENNISMDKTAQREIALTEIQLIKTYRYLYPNYFIGLGIHYMQYLYTFFPEVIKNRQQYFLRYLKRSI
jgi:glycosyltransferase involved in cell wall biosynthesis